MKLFALILTLFLMPFVASAQGVIGVEYTLGTTHFSSPLSWKNTDVQTAYQGITLNLGARKNRTHFFIVWNYENHDFSGHPSLPLSDRTFNMRTRGVGLRYDFIQYKYMNVFATTNVHMSTVISKQSRNLYEMILEPDAFGFELGAGVSIIPKNNIEFYLAYEYQGKHWMDSRNYSNSTERFSSLSHSTNLSFGLNIYL